MNTDIGDHEEKISAALTRTEELETWSIEANCAMQDIIQEQKTIMDKLDNNLGPVGIIYGCMAYKRKQSPKANQSHSSSINGSARNFP